MFVELWWIKEFSDFITIIIVIKTYIESFHSVKFVLLMLKESLALNKWYRTADNAQKYQNRKNDFYKYNQITGKLF